MRLIDSDSLIKYLKSWQNELLSDKQFNREYNLLEQLIYGIENEPTAFDIDMVLKQLDKLDDAALQEYNSSYAGTYEHDFADGKSCAFETAIDVVRNNIIYGDKKQI